MDGVANSTMRNTRLLMLFRPLLTGYLRRLVVFLPHFEMGSAIVSLEDKEVRRWIVQALGC